MVSEILPVICCLNVEFLAETTLNYHKLYQSFPLGNGMAERFNETLLNMIGTLLDEKKETCAGDIANVVGSHKHCPPNYVSLLLYSWSYRVVTITQDDPNRIP